MSLTGTIVSKERDLILVAKGKNLEVRIDLTDTQKIKKKTNINLVMIALKAEKDLNLQINKIDNAQNQRAKKNMIINKILIKVTILMKVFFSSELF